MKSHWALKISKSNAASLGNLRNVKGIIIGDDSKNIWIQGFEIDETLDKILLALPGSRYNIVSDNQLVPSNSAVPLGYLPKTDWIQLDDWLDVELPTSCFSGVLNTTTPLHLIRTNYMHETNMIIASFSDWYNYGINAPSLRLDCLQFALCSEEDVVIRGTPLPPIKGEHYVEQQSIASPAGWEWTPSLDVAVLNALFSLNPNDLAILHQDGSYDLILDENFVRASRSSVRASIEALQNGK